jgi:hypothetical protein
MHWAWEQREMAVEVGAKKAAGQMEGGEMAKWMQRSLNWWTTG